MAFKPRGVPARDLETLDLGLDELEALRLADLQGLYHEQAAARMAVSRATFGRLIEAARRKVAEALVHGKILLIKGGPIMTTAMRTFRCSECGTYFQVPHGTGRPDECPSCHAQNFHRADVPGPCGRRFHGRSDQPDAQPAGRGRCRRRGRGPRQAISPVVPSQIH
jgi:predicted DNA-binding protein (UPF0251 family)